MISVFLIWALILLIITAFAKVSFAPQTSTKRKLTVSHHMRYPLPNPIIRYTPPNPETRPQRIQRIPQLAQLARNSRNGRRLVETWRKSIVGLLKLADRNLKSAKQHLRMRNHHAAIQAASTGVENISCALIHCFGGKPEPDSGQEEALKLLKGRFQGEERIKFERAVDTIVHINLNNLKTHSKYSQLLNEIRTNQILESASEIIGLFTQIIRDHFTTEIPELGEMCPKCLSRNVSVWGFNREKTSYECNDCHFKWIEPSIMMSRGPHP